MAMTSTSARVTSYAMAFIVATTASGCRGARSPGQSPSELAEPISLGLPADISPAMIALGDSIFNNNSCRKCHLTGGRGGKLAPNLTDRVWIHIDGSFPAIVRLVTSGFTKDEQKDPQYEYSMNPRGGSNLSDAQIRAVAAYVWTLSHPKTL